MATREQLLTALRNADAKASAGDETAAADARKLAGMLNDMKTQPQDVEPTAMDTARGALEAINQGTTLGFGDEIVGAARAGLDRLFSSDYDFGEGMAEPKERSFTEDYKMYRDDQRNVADDFSDENPKTALALELAGGLFSPANVIGPWTQAAKGTSALKAAGQLGARGATEGAIAGAGGAEELTPQAVGRGALVGGVLGGGMGGLGRAVSSRKIDEELLPQAVIDEAKRLRRAGDKRGAEAVLEEGFTPIHMTQDDTILTDVYREGVGRVAGAASKLRNQEKPFLRHADELVEQQVVAKDAILESIASRPKLTPEVKAAQLELAKKQAKEGISQAAVEGKRGNALWKAVEAENFDVEDTYKKLDDYWMKDGFKEIKGTKFDVDDALKAKLRRKYGDEAVEEFENVKTMSGEALMDLRNEYAQAANVSSGMKKGKQRQLAKDIDDWMLEQLGGKRNAKGEIVGSPEAMRYGDELKSYGEFKAFERGVPSKKTKNKVYDVDAVARGRGKYGKKGEDIGQERATAALDKIEGLKEADAAATRAAKKGANERLKKAREQAKEVHRRSAPKASGLSELFTTRALGGAADLGVRGLTLPAGLGVGQALASRPGQRFVAGQTGWQKALQDDEYAKMLAQAMRQSISRTVAGE